MEQKVSDKVKGTKPSSSPLLSNFWCLEKASKNGITCIGAPQKRLQLIQAVIKIPEVQIRRREDVCESGEDETAHLAKARLTNFLNSLFANGKPKPTVKPSPKDPSRRRSRPLQWRHQQWGEEGRL
nr:hypothetical protein Iba_chr11eCG14270 [Ipomoea batatas]GME17354.1 hypothetical protein Iba_scaffold18628CG0010 [Ipomoea batatas]